MFNDSFHDARSPPLSLYAESFLPDGVAGHKLKIFLT